MKKTKEEKAAENSSDPADHSVYPGRIRGMLFVSHKNKIEKEQRKEAALAALDSIPEITATPAATATPVPTATPTPSLTPVPTILPAFEPENYQEPGIVKMD